MTDATGATTSEGGTGQPTTGTGGLSVPLGVHLETLLGDERRFQAERDRRYAEVAAERDRRLSEVAVEREKALKIKETADLAALQLAREIQTYKDEKANELREQINSERGNYLSRDEYTSQHQALTDKLETSIKPLADFVTAQQGRQQGIQLSVGALLGSVTLVGIITGLVLKLAGA